MKPLSVAVLCGGLSRRLGTDKALVSLVQGGPPLLARVIDRVRPLTGDLFLVGTLRPGYEQFNVPIVTDAQPGQGPLGGIATALTHARHSDCLIVACDMPFLSQDLLQFMAEEPRSAYDVLVPLTPAAPGTTSLASQYQPLHAIYRRTCLSAITARLDAGERRVTAFYDDVRVQIVTTQQAFRLDPSLRSFSSINTPEALREARHRLAESSLIG